MKQTFLADGILVGSTITAAAHEATTKQQSDKVYAISFSNYPSLVVVQDDEVLITDSANSSSGNGKLSQALEIPACKAGRTILIHQYPSTKWRLPLFTEVKTN